MSMHVRRFFLTLALFSTAGVFAEFHSEKTPPDGRAEAEVSADKANEYEIQIEPPPVPRSAMTKTAKLLVKRLSNADVLADCKVGFLWQTETLALTLSSKSGKTSCAPPEKVNAFFAELVKTDLLKSASKVTFHAVTENELKSRTPQRAIKDIAATVEELKMYFEKKESSEEIRNMQRTSLFLDAIQTQTFEKK